MPELALVLPVLTCALILLVSGAAKLRERQATADAFGALRVDAPSWAPALLAPAELVLGVALLVSPAPLLVVVASATLALLLAYWLVVARALRFEHPVRCGCFGRLGAHTITGRTLVRNTLLVLAGVLALVGALRGVSVPSALADLDQWWLWLVGAALAAAVCTLSLGGSGEPAAPAAAPAAEPGDDAGELDYVRHPIPYGQTRTPEGTQLTLHELATERPALLVALSPGCGPCTRIAPDLRVWEEQLGGVVAVRALFDADPERVAELAPAAAPYALYDLDLNVARVLRLFANPSAVLLGADGLLAGGPVEGEPAVRAMVEDIRAELADAGALPADSPEDTSRSRQDV